LWIKRGGDVEESLANTLSGQYGAELGVADFAGDPDAARKSINAWVADRTADRVRDLFAPHTIHNETRAALASAVYYKGAWSNRFEAALTKPLPFDAPGGRRRVSTMTQDERLPYAEIDGVQAVSLPYGSQDIEHRAAMLVLLPRPAENALASLEEKLSAEFVKNTVAALKEREVRLFLPKFTFHDTFDLRDALDGVGIHRAFDPEAAEFDGITTSERLYLEFVVHQAFVQVDETGTEAAAATGGGFGGAFGGAPPPPKRTIFRADRPFVFLIYEPRTGSILFLGRVTSPPEA
jgi:serpin B